MNAAYTNARTNAKTDSSALFGNYSRFPIEFTHGKGAWLQDAKGRKFLDCGAGVAVSSLGHGHPALSAAIARQAGKLIHCSNWYEVPQQSKLALDILKHCNYSPKDRKVLFANSGAEAIEAAIKLTRKFFCDQSEQSGQTKQRDKSLANRKTIVTLKGAFHGRTIATISAGANPKHTAGFQPLLKGFEQVDDIQQAVTALADDKVAGVMIESVRGEAGVLVHSQAALRLLSSVTRKLKKLLIADEIQSGVYRSGRFLACQHAGIAPDIIALAKGLGGGMPIGCIIARSDIAESFTPGSHGSTFAGSPFASAAAIAVLKSLSSPALQSRIIDNGILLYNELGRLQDTYPNIITHHDGIGLMQGVSLATRFNNIEVLGLLHKKRLLLIPAGDNSLRWLPPLVIKQSELKQGLKIFESTLIELANK